MSDSLSFQTVIEYIEALSSEDQALLFNLLHSRRLEKQRHENAQNAAQTLEALETGNATCDIRAAERSQFWGDEGKATYHVLIKNEPEEGVSATLLGWPECKAFGDN